MVSLIDQVKYLQGGGYSRAYGDGHGWLIGVPLVISFVGAFCEWRAVYEEFQIIHGWVVHPPAQYTKCKCLVCRMSSLGAVFMAL